MFRLAQLPFAFALTALGSAAASCGGYQSAFLPASPAAFRSSDSNVRPALQSDASQKAGCPCVFVTNYANNAITAYRLGATGNVQPAVLIEGSNTRLDFPTDLAFDASGKLYVANLSGDTVTVYAAGSSGNVRPIKIITGRNTELNRPNGIAVASNGDVYVANAGFPDSPSITVYGPGANGDAKPLRNISGPQTELAYPDRLLIESNGTLFVPDSGLENFGPGRILAFPPGANGNIRPSVKNIAGSRTDLDGPCQVGIGINNDLYAVNEYASNEGGAITIYEPRQDGNTPPQRTIIGASTQLNVPGGIVVDASGDIFSANVASSAITIYGPKASGNSAPIRKIEGASTHLDGPIGMAIH